MEDVDLMASRQEMEMAWASGGRTGEMGDEAAVPYPASLSSGCAQGVSEELTDPDHDLGPPGFSQPPAFWHAQHAREHRMHFRLPLRLGHSSLSIKF